MLRVAFIKMKVFLNRAVRKFPEFKSSVNIKSYEKLLLSPECSNEFHRYFITTFKNFLPLLKIDPVVNRYRGF